MNIRKLFLMVVVTAFVAGWLLPASGYNPSGASNGSGASGAPGETGNARTTIFLSQPGVIEDFVSEIAKGACGPVSTQLARLYGTPSASFCESMQSNSNVFLDEDADNSPAAVDHKIRRLLTQDDHDGEALPDDSSPPPDDMTARPLGTFGTIRSVPIPVPPAPPVFDCQTASPGSPWYMGNC